MFRNDEEKKNVEDGQFHLNDFQRELSYVRRR